MLTFLLCFALAGDVSANPVHSFTPARLAHDLVGQTVQVQGKDWTFSQDTGEYTKVKSIKSFTLTNKVLSVEADLDCHLC